KRTAQRPRNAGEELCGPEAPFDALLRELCACDAAAAVNLLVAETLELGEDAVRIDHGAANPAVAHEQVAAEADPKNGRIGIEPANEARKIVRVLRREEHFRRSANAPRGMARHRLLPTHATFEIRRQRERVHARPPAEAATNARGN